MAIWQIKKTALPGLDAHGRIVANWILSGIIYTLIRASCELVLGDWTRILTLILTLMWVLFPIIGGIKASNGEIWRYPFSITFLKIG